MSGRDQLIILLAVLVFIASVASGGWLGKRLNAQRSSLQLTYNQDVAENLPPDVALLVGASGSFRGVAIVYLWQRANHLKEEGKHFEAMELAQLIARLQPRFEDVWVFLSWNMAYNISVATHTEQERWQWVSDGVNLLRDEGIPWNPDAVPLYRQLSWIFLHKIGQSSDDMHWSYKQKLALEWQELLGPPPLGQTSLVLEWFQPVAAMDDALLITGEVSRGVRQQLGELIRQRERDLKVMDVERARDKVLPALVELMYQRPAAFDREAKALIERFGADEEALAERLAALIELNREGLWAQPNRETLGADARFLAAYPEAADLVAALAANGYPLNRETLRQIGRAKIYAAALANDYPVAEENLPDAFLLDWVRVDDEPVARIREEQLLPYLRAKVLREDYHMSPSFMYELMEGEWLVRQDDPDTEIDESIAQPFPIDWRHPAAQGLYWAARGVWVGKAKRTKTDDYYFDVLNTYRQVQHGLQGLLHSGLIVFDPLRQYYDLQADPRMIDGYLRSYQISGEAIGGMYAESAAPGSFSAGHENYLIWSINTCYEYGYTQKAQQLYDELRRLYGHKERRDRVYSKPLDKFVNDQWKENIVNPEDARRMIVGALRQYFIWAYANNFPERALSELRKAQFAYRYYESEQSYDTPNAYKGRMALPSFERMAIDTFGVSMTLPPGALPMALREKLWENAPNGLKQAVWDAVRGPLEMIDERSGRLAEMGTSFAQRYPEPQGMAEFRKQIEKSGVLQDVRQRPTEPQPGSR